MTSPAMVAARAPAASSERRIVLAASAGTAFEWYDFQIYGALAVFFGALFFPKGNETAGFLASLAAYGAGFLVRPLGAVVFGRLGDMVGRKYTFLVTIVLMGGSTAAVGLLPTYEQIGMAAPILLVALRLVQGLAIGGEYGGAAIYVAEHSVPHRRGYATSWIQTTATVGLLLSILVVLACRTAMSAEDFASWGWRLPFLFSFVLLVASVWMRARMEESPEFVRMKAAKQLSDAPVLESLGHASNLRLIGTVLVGVVAAQAVVWGAAQFYSLMFLLNTMKVDFRAAYAMCGAALVIGTATYVIAGWLSDRLGRKPVMLAGMVLFVATAFPCYRAIAEAANPALMQFASTTRIEVVAHPSACSINIFAKPLNDCDRVRDTLTKAGLGFTTTAAVARDEAVRVRVGDVTLVGAEISQLTDTLKAKGWTGTADTEHMRPTVVIAALLVLIAASGAIYGPLAAYLVELFPARIRYTSLSVPYHIGNGLFAGMLPFVVTAISVQRGQVFAGLWYPVIVTTVSFVVCLLFLPETLKRRTA